MTQEVFDIVLKMVSDKWWLWLSMHRCKLILKPLETFFSMTRSMHWISLRITCFRSSRFLRRRLNSFSSWHSPYINEHFEVNVFCPVSFYRSWHCTTSTLISFNLWRQRCLNVALGTARPAAIPLAILEKVAESFRTPLHQLTIEVTTCPVSFLKQSYSFLILPVSSNKLLKINVL